MSMTIDTLAFTKALETAGISREHAEAHANAVKDHVMSEVATKADIARLEQAIERQTLTLTVRLGGLLAMAVGIMATLKLL